MELKDKLKSKQAEAQKKFELLDGQRDTLVKQRAELDRRIAEITKEQVLLQGEFRALNDLLNDKEKPELKIPKKKK